MKTVLICDNLGKLPSDHLRREYPNALFEVVEEAEGNDPHGEMVCECFLKGHGKDEEVKVLIYPHIQLQVDNPEGWLDVIDAYQPHLANGSFAVWDEDDELTAMFMEASWTPERLQRTKRKLGGTNLFMSTGNYNRNWDEDEDFGYPQKAIQDLSNVYLIGSGSRKGFPAGDSSDGPKVLCMAWGKDQLLWGPIQRKYVWVSGTSFSSPLVMGVFARDFGENRFSQAEAESYILDRVTVADGWPRGQRHPVAGFGDFTSYWERTK